MPGFQYRDSRDLTGFIDGTENPEGEEARQTAIIPAGSPGEGGSFVLSQKWVHDLERGIATRLTSEDSLDRNPVWSPDGQHLLFDSDRDGILGVYSVRADGAGEPERLMESGIYAPSIRPPTVKQPRVRITVTALHAGEDIERLLLAL